MKKRVLSLFLAFAMTAAALSGCGSKGSEETTAAAGGGSAAAETTAAAGVETSQAGGETLAAEQKVQMNWAANNFYSFDNNKNYAAEEIMVQSHVLEGLVRPTVDENGEQVLAPAGAESWETSEDGLTWTFHLRNYSWSDGVQVTAQHFVDSFRRLGDPRNAFDFSSFIGDIVGGTELYNMDTETASDDEINAAMENLGVKAVDDTTLEVTLTNPAPQFLSKVGTTFMYPVRLDVIEAAGEMYDTDYSTHVWCGPFVVSDFVKDNSITLTKNENYWDAANVKLEEIDLINIGEASTQNTMFKNGELAVFVPTGDYVQPYRDGAGSGEYELINGYFPGISYFYFNRHGNSTSGLMESQKVRLALSLAAKREEFIQVIFNRYNPAYGFVPYGVTNGELNFRDDVTEPLLEVYNEYAGDAEKLKALFKEGMAELGDTRDLSEVTLTYICTGDTAIKRQQQEYWKNLWETTFGITVNVNVLGDSSLFREERDAGRYDIGQAGWNGDYSDPMAFVEMWSSHGTSIRYSGWTEELAAEFDKFMEQLNNEPDPAEREKIFAESEKWICVDEVAAIPYMYSDTIMCISSKLKGAKNPFVGPSIDLTHAYVVE